jgi:catechol 2,3-dioxygenase-like lactoylglutathione lyase family enzyme
VPEISHVLETALYVDDLAPAKRFYAQCLDLSLLHEDARMCAFAAGSTVLLLFQRGASLKPAETPGGVIPPHDGRGPLHVAFAIAAVDLPDWERKLEQGAIPIESRVRWPRGGESIYLRDPDGHLIELATPGLWPNF